MPPRRMHCIAILTSGVLDAKVGTIYNHVVSNQHTLRCTTAQK